MAFTVAYPAARSNRENSDNTGSGRRRRSNRRRRGARRRMRPGSRSDASNA